MLQIAQYQAVAPEGKKIHWCYFGLYSELCLQETLGVEPCVELERE